MVAARQPSAPRKSACRKNSAGPQSRFRKDLTEFCPCLKPHVSTEDGGHANLPKPVDSTPLPPKKRTPEGAFNLEFRKDLQQSRHTRVCSPWSGACTLMGAVFGSTLVSYNCTQDPNHTTIFCARQVVPKSIRAFGRSPQKIPRCSDFQGCK